MSVWFEEQDFEDATSFMRKHALEEMDHMTRIIC
jgi:ferritin